jgi:hypothetical protein
MQTTFIVVAVIALIGWVIARQLAGEPLRGRRVVLLPVILTVIGAVDLHHTGHLNSADIGCIAAGAVIAAAIGVGQGLVMRLESRHGGLWGQLPVGGLWLWGALIASRLLMAGIAVPLGAHAVATGDSILLVLGVNRLAQAGVITWRAFAAGIPFSSEQDGKTFLSGLPRQVAAPPVPPMDIPQRTVTSTRPARRHDRRRESILQEVAEHVADRLGSRS